MKVLRRIAFAGSLLWAALSPLAAVAQAPPPVPALPDTERRTSYSINASTCACAVNFALYGDQSDYQDWLEVWLNGVRVNYNDSTYGWTITSPTGTVGSIPLPITDAVLTFNNAQTGTVQIVGARRPRRLSQFSENQGIPARNLNQVITDLTAQNREIWDKTNDLTGRGLFFQPGTTTGPMPLPAACAFNVLGFDSTGVNPVCVAGPTTPQITIGGTGISLGTNGYVLYDNNGSLGNKSPTITINSTSCSLGGTCTITTSASSLTVGTTTIGSGNSGYILYQNGASPSGTVGEIATNGSGNVVLTTSPTLVTPVLGVAAGTSLALGGATIGGNALAVTGTTALSSTLTSTAHTITSASANALAVGLHGATNPALNVDASTASSATGLNVKSAAAAGGLAVSVITSGTNENLTIDAAGSGTITLGSVSTGAIIHTTATTLSAALTYGGVTLSNSVTGTGAMVLATAPSVSSLTVTTAFTATGLVTNADLANAATTVNSQTCTLGSSCVVTAAPTTLTVGSLTITSGTANGLLYNNGGTLGNLATGNNGVLVTSSGGVPSISTTLPSGLAATNLTLTTPTLGVAAGTSLALGGATLSGNALAVTGGVLFNNGLVLSGSLTYGGIQLNTAVTGTGNMVLSSSPSLTTPTLGVATSTSEAVGGCTIGSNNFCVTGTSAFNSAVTMSAALTYGGVTLSNAVTGTGNMVLSASPTFSGTIVFNALSPTSIGADTAMITGLAANNSPVASSDYVMYYSSANGAVNKATIAAITSAGVAGVSSLNGLVGGLSITEDAGPTINVSASVTSVQVSLNLSNANTWLAAQTFTNGDLLLKGSSSGSMTLEAPAAASTYVMTFPAATDTVAALGVANAFTGNNSYSGTTTWTGSLFVKVRSSGASTVSISATTDYFLCLDPTSNAIAADLPATPATGATYLIKDCTGQAATHNITVTPASGNIDGASTLVMSTNYQSLAVTYTGSQWSAN